MQKKLMVVTARGHHPESKAPVIDVRLTEGERTLAFGYDARQPELENHVEAALALLSEVSEAAGLVGYGQLGPTSYCFVTDLPASSSAV